MPSLVEGPQRQQPAAQGRRHHVDRGDGFDALAHEDGVTGAERRRGALVLVVDQDEGLTRLGVVQADAAGKAQRRVGDHAAGALGGERFVVHRKQRGERFGGQAGDGVGHGRLLSVGFILAPPEDRRHPILAVSAPHQGSHWGSACRTAFAGVEAAPFHRWRLP
jgi:hypothetical protein